LTSLGEIISSSKREVSGGEEGNDFNGKMSSNKAAK